MSLSRVPEDGLPNRIRPPGFNHTEAFIAQRLISAKNRMACPVQTPVVIRAVVEHCRPFFGNHRW